MGRLIRLTEDEVSVGTEILSAETVLDADPDLASRLVIAGDAVYLDQVQSSAFSAALDGDGRFAASFELDAESVELDLTDLSTVTNGAGDTAFSALTAMLIRNRSTEDTLLIGGAASDAWEPFAGAAGETVAIAPGGEFLYISDTAEGETTTDAFALKLDSGSATFSVDVAVRGHVAE